MWYRGARYRHMNCIDIDIEVVKVMYRDSKRVKLKVKFLLQHNRYNLGLPDQRVEIKKEDNWKWRMVPLAETINQQLRIY